MTTMVNHAKKIAESVLELIGNTPLVRLRKVVEPTMAQVLVKLESANPGGSVKDRICLSMIEDAETRGILRPGSVIVEPTSGNTGIGLAMVGAVKGYRVILTMPETMSVERISILKSFGAEIVLTPGPEGMIGAVKKAEEIVSQTPDAFMPQQFLNPANPRIHRSTTAQEILKATDGNIDAFVSAVGTGGTITGVGEVLKKKNPAILIVAVEPTKSAVLSGQKAGPHRIQGIGPGFVPQVLDRRYIDRIITIMDDDAFHMARRLTQQEGLLVGISSGAAVVAALQVARELGTGKTVVTVLPDTGTRYFSMEQFFDV